MMNMPLFRTKIPLWLRYMTHIYQLVIGRFPIHYNANMTGCLVFLCMLCLVVIKLARNFFVLAPSYNLGCYAVQFCDCVMVKNMPLFRTKMPLETRLSSCLYLLLARATWVLYMAFYDGRLVFLCCENRTTTQVQLNLGGINYGINRICKNSQIKMV